MTSLRVLVLSSVFALVSCSHAHTQGPSVEQTQEWLNTNIRLGSPASEVAAFLRSHELEEYRVRGDFAIVHDVEYDYKTHKPVTAYGYMVGWIDYPPSGERFLGIYCSTRIMVELDGKNRVTSRTATRASCTGP
jgi:hypothetical protein